MKIDANLERIIAKIDNDFNPDNSDWIPRVGAWVIDAMSILKVMQDEITTKTIEVKGRIAYYKCGFGSNIIGIYDSNGCEIKELDSKKCDCNNLFTGKGEDNELIELSNTMSQDNTIRNGNSVSIITETTHNSSVAKHSVINIDYKTSKQERNYVIIGNDKIELNFDTKCITVKYKGIKTEFNTVYNCEMPIIPNNGILIECLVAWCMYKMLCRGYKHPVFNLRDNSPAINPFIFWLQNKDNAKDSVTIDNQKDIDSKIWRSAFYIDTFDPRR